MLTVNALSKVVDSRTVKTLEAFDPFTIIDNSYRTVYGTGIFELSLMTPTDRWIAKNCTFGDCS